MSRKKEGGGGGGGPGRLGVYGVVGGLSPIVL